MTFTTSLGLFLSMVVLAALPGPGTLVVVGRTLAGGFRHGVSTAAGIVTGDYVYIFLAVFGLFALSEILGSLFVVVRYLGAAYLVWLGVRLLKGRDTWQPRAADAKARHSKNYLAGLAITIGNPKAFLFYVSFFPAFINLETLGLLDLAIILAIATVSVGSVMTAYAGVAALTCSAFQKGPVAGKLRYMAGGLLLAGAVFVVTRT